MSYRLTIREMTVDDVTKLKLDEGWMYDRFRYYIESHTGPAYIIEEEGQVLCAFGGLFEWDTGGSCETWFNLIDNKRTFNIARILKRMLVELADRYKITRMQAVVGCDNEISKRFLNFLGFINETPMGMKNKLHNGQSAYLYSRCF